MADRKRSLASTLSTSSAREETQADDSKRAKLTASKSRLIQLYGKNVRSNGKLRAAEQFNRGNDFKQIAQILRVAEATAEVYGIDAFAAGAPMDHVRLGEILRVSGDSFQTIQNCIEKNQDLKLRSIRDELQEVFSYNQIRFVLACMIRTLTL